MELSHTCLTVSNLDLDAVLGRLAGHGVAPDQPPSSTGSLRICFVCDPDGYAIELIEEET